MVLHGPIDIRFHVVLEGAVGAVTVILDSHAEL
jgi:hypothetical protein